MNRSAIRLIIFGVAMATTASTAFGQPTAFTYQGRLTNNGAPANGLYDFRLRLFDASTNGIQIGLTLCNDNIPINGGLFTVQLDFGQQFATIGQRFLEVEVRADTGLGCSTPAGLAVLAPRQQLTAAPIANHAKSAFALDASDGSIQNAVFVDSTGKVGIGTTAPQAGLHITREPIPPGGTLALEGSTHTYLSFFPAGFAAGRKGFFGFPCATCNDISLTNQVTLGNISLTAGPGGNVVVPSDVKLGPAQLFASAGVEDLRIIRGRVAGNGSVLSGLGFQVSHPSTGIYVITFDTAFTQTPCVTATHEGPNPEFMVVHSIATNSVQIDQYYSCDCALLVDDDRFQFIAIGPR